MKKPPMNNLCKYLIVAIILFLQGCTTSSITKTYKAPYSSIEFELTKYLDIPHITSNNEGGIRSKDIPHSNLDHFLANQGDYEDRGKNKKRYKPTYEVMDYTPGKKLIIKRFNYYNIGGSGSYGLLFNIKTVAIDSISVEVDYFDNALLLGFIPIISSGNKEEKYIHDLFFNKYELMQKQHQ